MSSQRNLGFPGDLKRPPIPGTAEYAQWEHQRDARPHPSTVPTQWPVAVFSFRTVWVVPCGAAAETAKGFATSGVAGRAVPRFEPSGRERGRKIEQRKKRAPTTRGSFVSDTMEPAEKPISKKAQTDAARKELYLSQSGSDSDSSHASRRPSILKGHRTQPARKRLSQGSGTSDSQDSSLSDSQEESEISTVAARPTFLLESPGCFIN
jgi:hypothetical protein